MLYYCPVYCSLDDREFRAYRSVLRDVFPEIATMGSLGCKAWGEVMLSHFEEEGVKHASKALDALMSYDDGDTDVIEVLEKLSRGGVDEMLVAIEVARALQPEKKLDRKLRPVLTEEFEVLPDPTPSVDPLELLETSTPELDVTDIKKTINRLL